MDPIIEQLKGKLIVSCQAYIDEPLRHPETMAQMARACELGGAGGIRCQGLSDISAIKGRTEVPVIGIWKEGHEGVYITPTLRHARACVAAGADIVAIDATDRPRPDGKTLEDTVRPLKEEGVLVMADCSTIEDIRHAFAIRLRYRLYNAFSSWCCYRLRHGRRPRCGAGRPGCCGIPRQAYYLRGPRAYACRCEGCNGCGRVGGCGWHRHHAPHEHYLLVRRGSGVKFFGRTALGCGS